MRSISLVESTCEFPTHGIAFRFVDDMPRLVQGDSARVVQIFANLISNSIKFTTCKCHCHIAGFASSILLQLINGDTKGQSKGFPITIQRELLTFRFGNLHMVLNIEFGSFTMMDL